MQEAFRGAAVAALTARLRGSLELANEGSAAELDRLFAEQATLAQREQEVSSGKAALQVFALGKEVFFLGKCHSRTPGEQEVAALRSAAGDCPRWLDMNAWLRWRQCGGRLILAETRCMYLPGTWSLCLHCLDQRAVAHVDKRAVAHLRAQAEGGLCHGGSAGNRPWDKLHAP